MDIVVAPDKFKGTLTAAQVAAAMMRGARSVFPSAAFHLRPLADGGEGTCEALLVAVGGRSEDLEVAGPLGEPVHAPIAYLGDGRAALEMAAASGSALVQPSPNAAMRASTVGTGTLIAEAAKHADGKVVVGIGGSASTDGGTGAGRAVGWRFLDASGSELPLGGAALVDLARIDGSEVEPSIRAASIVAATDVATPLTGPRGSARAFAPQKGAGPEDVAILERGLEVLAERIRLDLGIDVDAVPGGGAGGGMGAGLAAFFEAELMPGFDLISEAVGLEASIAAADLVITGEGRLDENSKSGKVPVGVARLCRKHGATCVAIAGEITLPPSEVRSLGFGLASTARPSDEHPDPAGAITAATERILRKLTDREPRRRRVRGLRLRGAGAGPDGS